MQHKRRAFTVVELTVAIAIIGILVSIGVVSYGAWRRNTAEKVLRSDISSATNSLRSYMNFKNTYPPNLAGTGFASSPDSALALYTDAPSIGTYNELTPNQNAQLFLNTCNANLDNAGYNTACVFNGNGGGAKIHVKGTNGTNFHWTPSPLTETYLRANCQSICGELSTMISQFQAQGGTLPIVVSGSTATLPEPTQTPSGPASRYCLSGRNGTFPDLIFHTSSSSSTIESGECPSDPGLKYFP